MTEFLFCFICDLTWLALAIIKSQTPSKKKVKLGKIPEELKKAELRKNAPKPLPDAGRDRELVNLHALDIAQSSVLRENFYLWLVIILY